MQGQPTALVPHKAGRLPRDRYPAKALPQVKAVQKLGLLSNLNSLPWKEANHRGQCCCAAVRAHCTLSPGPTCNRATATTLLALTSRHHASWRCPVCALQLSTVKETVQAESGHCWSGPGWRDLRFCPILFCGIGQTFWLLCCSSSFCKMVVVTVFHYPVVRGDFSLFCSFFRCFQTK